MISIARNFALNFIRYGAWYAVALFISGVSGIEEAHAVAIVALVVAIEAGHPSKPKGKTDD